MTGYGELSLIIANSEDLIMDPKAGAGYHKPAEIDFVTRSS